MQNLLFNKISKGICTNTKQLGQNLATFGLNSQIELDSSLGLNGFRNFQFT